MDATTSSMGTTSAVDTTDPVAPDTGSESGSESSSSGAPPLDGPGCGVTPSCDRGTFEGHAKIESLADLQQLAGYSKVSGHLEISGSTDLVCLDALACLEEVGRDLRVQENAALRSTHGLRNLRRLGEGYASQWTPSTVFIGENAVLEAFEGFSLEGYTDHLVIWKNPALADVSNLHFEYLETLSVLENPRLEALSSLHGLPETSCFINRNPRLCTPEIQLVCGDESELSRVYNGVECPEGPPARIEPDDPSEACSLQTEDCPAGEKCVPPNSTSLECRPLVESPKAVGEACSLFEAGPEYDDCERHAVCRGGTCWAMAFGDEASLACPRSDQYPMSDADGVELYCAPACDPIADECPGDQVCVPYYYGRGLTCGGPRSEEPGELGDPCWINSCGKGLACAWSEWNSVCDPRAGTCCLPFCDIFAPDCPVGSTCVSRWDEEDDVVPKLEHVGICLEL